VEALTPEDLANIFSRFSSTSVSAKEIEDCFNLMDTNQDGVLGMSSS
jgi:Ca2+-binding EF-hand superfamily protein